MLKQIYLFVLWKAATIVSLSVHDSRLCCANRQHSALSRGDISFSFTWQTELFLSNSSSDWELPTRDSLHVSPHGGPHISITLLLGRIPKILLHSYSILSFACSVCFYNWLCWRKQCGDQSCTRQKINSWHYHPSVGYFIHILLNLNHEHLCPLE